MVTKRGGKRKKLKKRLIIIALEIILVIILGIIVYRIYKPVSNVKKASNMVIPDWIDVQLIDEGNPSRSGERLDAINAVVIHYVGNPGTTALQNRDFYNHEDSDVSSHFVIGMDGEIIMCLPLDERSAASNDRNHDTISIEVCHPDETGEFTRSSYDSLIRLTKYLMVEFGLSSCDVIRHYDVTGKECPRYFVTHEDAWERFREDISAMQ